MSDNSELDVINHLLEVEKNAAVLIENAQIEAEKKIQDAKVKYNQEYKAKFDVLVSEKEEAYHKKIEELENAHKVEIEEFKQTFESKPQNVESFNKLLDKLLFN